ncbi:MAG: Holliday junction resolvase-like protein [Anaerolineales bacterium]
METLFWLFLGLIFGFLVAALLVYLIATRRSQEEMQRLVQNYEARLRQTVEAYEGRVRQTIESYEARIRRLDEEHRKAIEQARRQSVEQSRHTLKGQISEQLVPLLPGFEFLPSDARFIGHPVDYVVFHGYTDLRDGNGRAEQLEVVILDIKRDSASLTKEQKAILEAVRAGRVSFQVVRVDEQGRVQKHSVGYRKA